MTNIATFTAVNNAVSNVNKSNNNYYCSNNDNAGYNINKTITNSSNNNDNINNTHLPSSVSHNVDDNVHQHLDVQLYQIEQKLSLMH